MNNTKMNKIVKSTVATAFALSILGCGGSSSSSSSISTAAVTTTHNGVVYGLVTSSKTSKVWLDRNLGASRICTSISDLLCIGDFYQWGRDSDGHQESTSSIVTTQATDIYNVGHGNYIDDENNTFNHDWAANDDTDGSLRSFQWSKIDGSSVCPVGFRVPTLVEWQNESFSNKYDAFNSLLKIPAAGRRDVDGIFFTDMAILSTSDTNTTSSKLIGYDSNSTTAGNADRILGSNVRCIKD